jgi:hypothetical protein
MSISVHDGSVYRTASGIYVVEGGLWHRIKKFYTHDGSAYQLGWNLGIPSPSSGSATRASISQADLSWTNGSFSVANATDLREDREIDGAGKYWHYFYFTPDENCESARTYSREGAAKGDPNSPWELRESLAGPFGVGEQYGGARGGYTGGYADVEWLVMCFGNSSYTDQGFSVRLDNPFE